MSFINFLQGYQETNFPAQLNDAIQYYLSNGDFEAASNGLCQLISLNGSNPVDWTNLGHCYLIMQKFEESFRAYSNAHQLWNDSAPAQLWYGLGLLCSKCRLFEIAEKYFEATLRTDPNFEYSPQVYLKLGIINKNSKQYLKAITYLRNCLNIQDLNKDETIEVLCQIASCLEISKKNEALELYKIAKNLQTNLKTTVCLGWGHFINWEYDKAILLFNEALSFIEDTESKGYCDILYLKARCLAETKSFPRALSIFNAITGKYPEEPIYKVSLAVVFAELKQCQNALKCLCDCLSLKYDEVDVYVNLGVINELMFQRDEAKKWYQKAIEKSPTSGTANNRLNLLNKQKNRPRNIPNLYQPSIDITEFPFRHFEMSFMGEIFATQKN
ncbi:unnamed protein product [Blepharisma stoltei]|uniref:Uncharacterized protein n=1 Tax=Blepharisma stoltei TaxID=1481888 RepID=A0AAU9IFI3_9CILI|nr:unnamed protein product [Blepharisma stoltei]